MIRILRLNYARIPFTEKCRLSPPELEQRREAVELVDLLKGIRQDDPRHSELSRRLAVLELKLRQAGMNTDFLHGEYGERLMQKINEE
jgi:hypothetical protein